MPRISDTITRLTFLGCSIAALGLLTLRPENESGWVAAGAQASILHDETAPQRGETQRVGRQRIATQWVEAIPTAYRETQSTSPTCNAWDVSPAAMEAILDEMVRRGWRPPTQGGFLASLHTGGVEAEDPNAPMPVGPARSNPLLSTAEPAEDFGFVAPEGFEFQADVPAPPMTVPKLLAPKPPAPQPPATKPAVPELPVVELPGDAEAAAPDPDAAVDVTSEPAVDAAPPPAESPPEPAVIPPAPAP